MKNRIIIWLFEKLLSEQNRQIYISDEYEKSLDEKFVKDKFFKISKRDLKLNCDIIKVKKGKLKYHLAIFKTPQAKTKVWLRRHTDSTIAILN